MQSVELKHLYAFASSMSTFTAADGLPIKSFCTHILCMPEQSYASTQKTGPLAGHRDCARKIRRERAAIRRHLPVCWNASSTVETLYDQPENLLSLVTGTTHWSWFVCLFWLVVYISRLNTNINCYYSGSWEWLSPSLYLWALWASSHGDSPHECYARKCVWMSLSASECGRCGGRVQILSERGLFCVLTGRSRSVN